MPRERGPGSQGACPLAEFEAAPQARIARPFPVPSLFPAIPAAWIVLLLVDFPAPCSPCFHPHSDCGLGPQVPAGVLISRGAAISVTNCRVPVAWLPSFCRDLAVTPTRRFRILRRIQSFPKIDLMRLRFFPSLWLPLPPSGCTADRKLPLSPT